MNRKDDARSALVNKHFQVKLYIGISVRSDSASHVIKLPGEEILRSYANRLESFGVILYAHNDESAVAAIGHA